MYCKGVDIINKHGAKAHVMVSIKKKLQFKPENISRKTHFLYGIILSDCVAEVYDQVSI